MERLYQTEESSKSEDAKTAAGELDGPIWVVKAQIHAGGREKAHSKSRMQVKAVA